MHIEFTLPTGPAGFLARRYGQLIEQQILAWLESNSIRDYDIRYSYNVLAFTLSQEQHYTLFLLAWEGNNIAVPKLVLR